MKEEEGVWEFIFGCYWCLGGFYGTGDSCEGECEYPELARGDSGWHDDYVFLSYGRIRGKD